MACFLITDYDFPDIELELALYREAGVEVRTAQCRTEDDVIAASQGCDGLLVQSFRHNRSADAFPQVEQLPFDPACIGYFYADA